MTAGIRRLCVLGEFKPFGLMSEALDGQPSDSVADNYEYFLFDPEVAREREESDADDASVSALSNRCDHELFIRGNRIIWSTGSGVHKRFTLPSSVVKACWCRLSDMPQALLCVLQIGSLTIYSVSGEVVSIQLSHSITSIWPLPFGLLLQQETEGILPAHLPFSSCSPLLSGHDMSCPKREIGHSQRQNFSLLNTSKGDGASFSSHLILKDLLEEPQSTYIEERGKLNIMKEFDERTIWTSNVIPLMASYNKGKMQHSVWVAEVINSSFEVPNSSLFDQIPPGMLPKEFSFRRIWQGKGSQTAACKVFLATDDDAAPLICFLLQEQKSLLSLRLQCVEINNEIVFDIKPDMSWSIPAVAAVPVIVTRPRAKVGLLPFADILVLASENTLLLYSGKQCLCRYLLPYYLGKGVVPSHALESSESTYTFSNSKIVGLADAVEGRVNVIINNGQMFRCALRRSPSSSLANDCISAMAEGLSPSSYNHFLVLLWGDGDAGYLSKADSSVDSEWESFSSIIMQMCKKSGLIPPKLSDMVQYTSWESLIRSNFHKNYSKLNLITNISSEMTLELQESDSSKSYSDVGQGLERLSYSEPLKEILDSLHAVYETLKLDNLRKRYSELISSLVKGDFLLSLEILMVSYHPPERSSDWDLGLLVVVLCDVANFLGEGNYLDYYFRDFPCTSKKFWTSKACLTQRTPPSLFRWLENCLQYGCDSTNIDDLPLLIHKDGHSVSWARKIVSFYSLLSGAKQVGRKLSSGVYCNIAPGSSSSSEELTVLAMVGEKFGLQQMDLLPAGVSLPLRHVLDKCRESPPTDWPAAAYVLLGREDLALSCLAHSHKYKELETQTNMNLISMSTPYMLHLHPVTIPSTSSDTIGLHNTKFEDTDSLDGSMTDGMEQIFNSSTQLRYGRDLRLNEVRRLLCSAKPVSIQTLVNPSAADQDVQQAQLWQLAQRTTALPLGRGAFTLATTCTLLTETFSVPKLVLAGGLPTQQNATVNLDPNTRNIQELISWPEFHNAVAAGLRLAPLQGKMSRTWIIYNKPAVPNAVHAGLLFALGLHGYLGVLTITDIYQYFSQVHESTTVGLMLGLAASYRGTMEPSVLKSFYVQIPSRHPPSFPEIEVPTLVQSAALLSIGILFEGSAQPQSMYFLLGEIGRLSGSDNVLEREAYALSAGLSLGLVALGRGDDALGFMDALVDRLFQYVGGQELHNGMEGTPVNVDVTAPGAIIALGLMFLKTESEVMVSRLSIPHTQFALQYVRPDFVMLRIIARNLIMWSRVHPSKDWIQSQIPEIIRNGVEGLGNEIGDTDENKAEALFQAYVNMVTGACISLGLKFAGTKNGNAQELLYEYAVYFLNEIKPVSMTNGNTLPKGLSRFVDRGSLETCLHLIVLSLSVVMAGSGHLQTFRLLRFLRSRTSADGHANYGFQMAVSLAIGFLFLGGGMRTFSTSNSSIAALLISLYPRLPTGPNDNRCHLQAYRHLYVLATEARWIQTVDVDTGLPVYVPLEVTVRETEHFSETSFFEVTPCILPERAALKRVRVCGPRYWSQVIEIVHEDKPWWSFGDKNNPFNSGVLYIKRKIGACSYVDDPIGCQSLLSRAMHKVFGLTRLRTSSSSTSDHSGPGSVTVDQLVSTFSSDPSLIAFAQLCCDPSWNGRSDADFQEFCLQVLFECVSKDRPALLQVYLALYNTIGSMADQVTCGNAVMGDSLFISSLKLALAYYEAQLSGRLTASKGGIIQSVFIGSLSRRVEDLLNCSPGLKNDFYNYLNSGRWPNEESLGGKDSILLSWYLQWFCVPAPSMVRTAVEKIRPKIKTFSSIPLLRLLLPRTHIHAIGMIDKFLVGSQA